MTDRERLVCQHLSQFVSDHKKEFVDKVLNARTRNITVVLEDIFQSQNASAVIRTCECMGIQDIHIVENITKYSINPRVLKGSNKWIDIIHHCSKSKNNTETLFRQLKDADYKIIVTDPGTDGISIENINVQEKIALVFGNELRGISSAGLSTLRPESENSDVWIYREPEHIRQCSHLPQYYFNETSRRPGFYWII